MFKFITLIKGKAMYIRPTSLLMPVGYRKKKVLYLQDGKKNVVNISLYYASRSRLNIQTSYLSHRSHDGANPKASFMPKKE